jgi:hypothetical protein
MDGLDGSDLAFPVFERHRTIAVIPPITKEFPVLVIVEREVNLMRGEMNRLVFVPVFPHGLLARSVLDLFTLLKIGHIHFLPIDTQCWLIAFIAGCHTERAFLLTTLDAWHETDTHLT